MSEANIRFLRPILRPQQGVSPSGRRSLPWVFIALVLIPTAVAAVYFLMIASPRYVSEAQFIVRSSEERTVSSLGAALEGVGIGGQSANAHAVLEYIKSPDGLAELSRTVDVRGAYARPGIDAFSRLPRPFSDSSNETFRKQFNSYITVGYDSQTGISTLRVQAFAAADAQRIADGLLNGGEALVNRLSERSSADAVAQAERNVIEAQARLDRSLGALTAFRNREGIIDPTSSARASGELVGQLSLNLATMQAERNQIAMDTPNSPQLPIIDGRIRALERQIAIERAKIVGDASSLAPRISSYENLQTEREFSERLLASSTAALNAAQLTARSKRLYIDRIVNPDRPDRAVEPQRLLSLLTVFASLMLIYGLGWLVFAGVRESRVHR